MQTRRRVLVVDDDEDVRTAVTWALEADGFEVVSVANGLDALALIEASTRSPSAESRDSPPHPPANSIALVVLDLSLPGLGGLDILRKVRAAEANGSKARSKSGSSTGSSYVPIIVLSGRESETDRIVGLDLGADDYLVKPFSLGELSARARSVLRRAGVSTGGNAPFEPIGSGVELDRESRNVWLEGAPVELSAKEFDLLAYFVDHPRRACSRSELLAAVWSSNSGWQNESTVTEHVYRLRQKLESDPARPQRLRTVRAIGYRWEA